VLRVAKIFFLLFFCLIFVSVFGDKGLDNAFEELESSCLFGYVHLPVFEVLAIKFIFVIVFEI
jgi:hypothetical protein